MPYPYAELPRKEVEALGIKTSYIIAGQPDAPLVVLLHGMSASADVFREIMHELAAEFWLIAPDIPGYGLSDDTEPYTLPHLVEWLASFREALDLPVMMLVGHSFGQSRATGSVLKALAFQDIEPRLPGIRQPVCIIWGKNDPVLPADHASEIAEALPDARVIVWDQCGHLPFMERQEEFLAIARSFLLGEEV